jgi:polyhydroxyalkanoate synthesis regulator phasin
MFETIDKLMFASLGALSMTKERAEKIFDDYVRRGQMEKEGRSGFVKDIMDSAEKSRKNLEKLISEQVEKTVDKMNLASKEDIKRLEEKIGKLLKKEK